MSRAGAALRPAGALGAPPVYAGDVAVRAIAEHAGVTTITFDAPNLFAAAAPGQFLLASSNRDGAPLLARPMSIIDTDPLTISFGYQGEGTRLIAAAVPGEPLHLFGPLGLPFEPLGPDLLVVVEGAHFGTMLALCRARAAAGEATTVLFVLRPAAAPAGPVTAGEQDAALAAMFAPYATVETLPAAAVPDALAARRPAAVAAGASDAVMAAVQAHCADTGAPGVAALQVAMPCGIGACRACVKPARDGGLIAVCEGPIFPIAAPRFA